MGFRFARWEQAEARGGAAGADGRALTMPGLPVAAATSATPIIDKRDVLDWVTEIQESTASIRLPAVTTLAHARRADGRSV